MSAPFDSHDGAMILDSAAILERRAARVRARPVEIDDAGAFWVAEFPMADERYGVALSVLRAAVPLSAVRGVPLSPPEVIGVLRFQGQLITALSLASLLGVKGWRHDPVVLLIVDLGWGRLCALDCEAIPKPVSLPMTVVEAARAGGWPGPILEVTTEAKEQLHLLDLARLLDRRNENRNVGA